MEQEVTPYLDKTLKKNIPQTDAKHHVNLTYI